MAAFDGIIIHAICESELRRQLGDDADRYALVVQGNDVVLLEKAVRHQDGVRIWRGGDGGLAWGLFDCRVADLRKKVAA